MLLINRMYIMSSDQTPTPTRFLRNCEEIGLFNELKSNPFEEAFKKASDFIGPDGKIIEQPGQVRQPTRC